MIPHVSSRILILWQFTILGVVLFLEVTALQDIALDPTSLAQSLMLLKVFFSFFLNIHSKAYIPLRRKIPGVGGWRWAMPPTPDFALEIPTCWYILALPNAKICVFPDASQWNIGCVGSQRKMLVLAMYISCFLCRFHLHLVPNANPISSGIWALDVQGNCSLKYH